MAVAIGSLRHLLALDGLSPGQVVKLLFLMAFRNVVLGGEKQQACKHSNSSCFVESLCTLRACCWAGGDTDGILHEPAIASCGPVRIALSLRTMLHVFLVNAAWHPWSHSCPMDVRACFSPRRTCALEASRGMPAMFRWVQQADWRCLLFGMEMVKG